jgi:hypothetical protein
MPGSAAGFWQEAKNEAKNAVAKNRPLAFIGGTCRALLRIAEPPGPARNSLSALSQRLRRIRRRTMIETAIERILTKHGIANAGISHIKSADREHLFFINDEYVLRISEGNNDSHIDKLRRIEGLASVQRIVAHGAIESGSLYNYLLCAKLKGIDFIDAASSMSPAQMAELGGGIGGFLDALHAKAGSRYDIGHYIPIIPGHKDSWAQGHSKYWNTCKRA